MWVVQRVFHDFQKNKLTKTTLYILHQKNIIEQHFLY